MQNSLDEALKSNIANTMNFSKDIDKTYGEVKVLIPIQDARLLYQSLKEEINDFTSSSNAAFVDRGLDYIDTRLIPRKAEVLLLGAHAAFMLRSIAQRYTVMIPAWLPEIFRVEVANENHQYKYLFNWSTVNACHVPHNLEGYMKLKLGGSISLSDLSGSTNKKMATSGEIAHHNNKVTAKHIEADKKVDTPIETPHVDDVAINHMVTKVNSKEVDHGSFVAKKYLWLMDSAASRGMDFSISIEELSALLRDKMCYYTKVALVSFPHEKRDNSDHLPANYLTIDRKNNDEGYVSGNVVVCSKEINELKNQMSEKDFLQAIAFKSLVEQANLNPDQLNAFTVMMNIKAS